MTTKEAMQGVSAKKRAVQSVVRGVLIGFICGFVGAGGGMMMLLILTSVLGYELKTAVGTSVFIMAFTALTGAASHFAIGGAPDWDRIDFVCCIYPDLDQKHVIGLAGCVIVVTAIFYLILAKLDTSNIVFSTISIITSFFATSLTMLRSFYYAIGYAANDLVRIVLWVLASIENPGYIPVVVNFVIFFLNDMYGFVSWKKRELQQA